MSQKVKIQTGFSEKTSENYNSQQFSVALEMECQINGSTREIEEASGKLFALCRKIVSAQKGVNVDTLLNSETVPGTAPAPATPATGAPAPVNGPGPGAPKPASAKQIKYLLDSAKRLGLSKVDIQNLPATFKKTTFEALSSIEASRLIELLARKKAA